MQVPKILYLNGSVDLNCTMVLEAKETVPQLVWNLPKGHLMSDRIVKSNQTKERNAKCGPSGRFECALIYKTLHIEPLVMEDMGTYTCMAVINGQSSNPSSIVLKDILQDREKAGL